MLIEKLCVSGRERGDGRIKRRRRELQIVLQTEKKNQQRYVTEYTIYNSN